MLDLRVLIAACAASLVILALGLGLLVSFKAAREPGEGLVQNVRIRESTRVDPGAPDAASLPVPVATPAPRPAIVTAPAPKPVIQPVATPARDAVVEPVAMPTIPPAPIAAPPPPQAVPRAATEIVTTGAIPEPTAATTPETSPAPPVPRTVVAPDQTPKPKTTAIAAKPKGVRPRRPQTVRNREPSDPISALINSFQR